MGAQAGGRARALVKRSWRARQCRRHRRRCRRCVVHCRSHDSIVITMCHSNILMVGIESPETRIYFHLLSAASKSSRHPRPLSLAPATTAPPPPSTRVFWPLFYDSAASVQTRRRCCHCCCFDVIGSTATSLCHHRSRRHHRRRRDCRDKGGNCARARNNYRVFIHNSYWQRSN